MKVGGWYDSVCGTGVEDGVSGQICKDRAASYEKENVGVVLSGQWTRHEMYVKMRRGSVSMSSMCFAESKVPRIVTEGRRKGVMNASTGTETIETMSERMVMFDDGDGDGGGWWLC